MKVYIVVEYVPSEGGDVEGVFYTKEEAVDFASSKIKGNIERRDYKHYDMFSKPTTYLRSDEDFLRWKIEEWEVRGTP